MSDEKNSYDICVDVDTLFDTRLPLLYGLNDEVMRNVLADGSYFTRSKDEFGDIPANVFRGYYANRDKRLLLAAQPTEMFNLIVDYVVSTLTNKSNIGDVEDITLYLNTYPYELLDGEIDTIADLLSSISERLNVIPINVSNKDLTPTWLEDDIGILIKYDLLDWLDHHIAFSTITKTPLLDVMALCPRLILGDVASKDVSSETFNSLLESMTSLIGFNFVKTSYYCIMQDIETEKNKTKT